MSFQNKFFLTILILIGINTFVLGQLVDSLNAKSSWYIRTMPMGYYANAGKFNDRMSQNIEIGRSISVLDVGLAYGRNSLRSDTTSYLQARITMDACQYGIFSNEVAIGIGKVFNSNMPLMLEFSTTILAQISKNIGIGAIVGGYDFSGEVQDSSKQFYGIFLRLGLQRNQDGYLIKRPLLRPFHHIKRIRRMF